MLNLSLYQLRCPNIKPMLEQRSVFEWQAGIYVDTSANP